MEEGLEIVRSRSHGHVAAVRAMIRRLGLMELVAPQRCREQDLIEALLVARVLEPQTKLATTRWWQTTTLAEDLGLEGATEDEVYAAMDWLLARQPQIEARLARRHLGEGSLVLYDVSASHDEGTHCPLAAFGHNREGRRGKRQIWGLMTDEEGRPIAVEVFPGNTGDPSTVEAQVDKLKERFGLGRVVLAGDRGMLTQARIERLKAVGGIDWVSALRAPAIRRLAEQGSLQLSLFDEQDLAEIVSPDFPGERLIVCRNPFLAENRARTRQELLEATEKRLQALARRVASGRLKRKEKIGQALGRILARSRMGKHFRFHIDEGAFRFERDEANIREEAALDGLYVLRTSVPKERWEPEQVVRGYKSLSHAERAFRTLKGVELRVRPIHHRLEDRVRAHTFLCLLAYYVEWHLREAWRPLLFDDEEGGHHLDDSPVRPAVRSPGALRKAATQPRPNGQPVHSFRTLLAELGTVVRNVARVPAIPQLPPFALVTTPSPLQREAFERVGLTEDLLGGRRQKSSA